jgi:hypothetical protein
MGQWNKAADSFKNAIEVVMPQTVGGDPKTYEECTIGLGTIYFLQGDTKQSLALFQEALDSAIRRGDTHMQLRATNALARNYYTMGEYVKCIQCLEEVRRGIESSGQNNGIYRETGDSIESAL